MHKKSDFFQDVKTTSKEAVFLGHSLYDELAAGKGSYRGPRELQNGLQEPQGITKRVTGPQGVTKGATWPPR